MLLGLIVVVAAIKVVFHFLPLLVVDVFECFFDEFVVQDGGFLLDFVGILNEVNIILLIVKNILLVANDSMILGTFLLS
jgi:hypothetical protein